MKILIKLVIINTLVLIIVLPSIILSYNISDIYQNGTIILMIMDIFYTILITWVFFTHTPKLKFFILASYFIYFIFIASFFSVFNYIKINDRYISPHYFQSQVRYVLTIHLSIWIFINFLLGLYVFKRKNKIQLSETALLSLD